MYVVELRFDFAEESVPPSFEVIEASVRQNGHGGRRIEHIAVKRVQESVHVVAFVLTKTAADAGEMARTIGMGVTTDFRQVRFCGFRIWRDEIA